MLRKHSTLFEDRSLFVKRLNNDGFELCGNLSLPSFPLGLNHYASSYFDHFGKVMVCGGGIKGDNGSWMTQDLCYSYSNNNTCEYLKLPLNIFASSGD